MDTYLGKVKRGVRHSTLRFEKMTRGSIKLTSSMDEIWSDVVGYEGMYEVSIYGRVRSLRNGKIRIMKPVTNPQGYRMLILSKDKITKPWTVHRLVLTAFVPNPLGKPNVDHIDNNRSNNIVTNLRWATYRENNGNTHGWSEMGIKGVKAVNAQKGLRYVAAITYCNKRYHLGTFDTAEQAQDAYKLKAKELFGEFAKF
jgi:hypothetical protein